MKISASEREKIDELVFELTDDSDGPVTQFTMIHKCIMMAKHGTPGCYVLANALNESLLLISKN